MLTWARKSWDEITPETIRDCWWKSGLLPLLCPTPQPRAKRSRLAPLNLDALVVHPETVVEGPRNLPLDTQDDDVVEAVEQLDRAIRRLNRKVVLEEG